MPTPRLTLVARVSALYASVRPRIGSPGTSSTFEKKDTAWLCDGGRRFAARAARRPQKPPNRSRVPAAARPFPRRRSGFLAPQLQSQQHPPAGARFVVAPVGFVDDHRACVLAVEQVVDPGE